MVLLRMLGFRPAPVLAKPRRAPRAPAQPLVRPAAVAKAVVPVPLQLVELKSEPKPEPTPEPTLAPQVPQVTEPRTEFPPCRSPEPGKLSERLRPGQSRPRHRKTPAR